MMGHGDDVYEYYECDNTNHAEVLENYYDNNNR